MPVPDHAEAVIVGAGLAGLNAARELVAHGVDVVVLESADRPGGRVATDAVDGRLLDRGFQLYNPAYPEGARVFGPRRLALRAFARGVTVMGEAGPLELRDPRRDPLSVRNLPRVPGGPVALGRFASYLARCGFLSVTRLGERPDEPMRVALREAVGSRDFFDAVVQPFLAGVFGDRDLDTSRRYGDLVLRSFVRGTPSLPSRGMEQLPLALCRDVGSDRIHCGVRVQAVTPTAVVHDGGTIRADRVVVATDGTTAAALVPGVPAPQWNALTTWYFSAPADGVPADPRLLMVDGRSRGVLVNVAAVSAVAPAYARPGELLVAATAVGVHDGDAGARRHLGTLIPGADRWELVGRYAIPRALPAIVPPADLRGRQDFDGILVAGDHRDTPSIQGALVSGRRAARTVVRERAR
ncbi:MAG: FAD-dependent oxidoreductase [Candidatus Nanopelagicales bacterium]